MSNVTIIDRKPFFIAKPRLLAWLAAFAAPLVLGPLWVIAATGLDLEIIFASLNGFVLIFLLIVSTYTDLRWHRIPNWITYPAVCWAFTINVIAACHGLESQFLGAVGFSESVLGFFACFMLTFMIYACGGSGAGDVKMAAAVGALAGLPLGLSALVWCYMTAGVVILGYLVMKCGPLALLKMLCRRIGSFFMPRLVDGPVDEHRLVLATPVPMALFLAIGVAIALGRNMP